MNMASILVRNISDCLRQTYLIGLEKGKHTRIIVPNLEEISYKSTATRLHLRADDVNSGPFSVYTHGNATPKALF